MSQITKPNTLSAGNSILATEHNENFNTLYNDFNGNIVNFNIATTAGITDDKLSTIVSVGKVNFTAIGTASTTSGGLLYATSSTSFACFATGTSGQYLSWGTLLDNMEYSTNALARAAYVANGIYGDNFLIGGTSSATDETYGIASYAVDGNVATRWCTDFNKTPASWEYALPAGITKVVTKLRIHSIDGYTKDFTLDGSNNGSSWTNITSGQIASTANGWTNFTFANSTAYRYFLLTFSNSWGVNIVSMQEVEMMETGPGTETTIKTQGSYSLKGIILAGATTANMVRTVTPTISLSGFSTLKIDMNCTRTGSNIKIGIHDSGGTTTEITPNITNANVWQTITWDISGVANANKDAIDSITITAVDVVSDNIIYIDNFYCMEPAFGWQGP